jgi:hypothetical protein
MFESSRYLPVAPVTMSPDSYRELMSAERLLRLLTKATMTLGGTARTRARLLGMDERWDRFFVDQAVEDAFAASIARPDALPTSDGFRFLEVNVSAGVGLVVETHTMGQVWRNILGRAGEPPLWTLADPLKALTGFLHRVCDERHIDRKIAIVGEQPTLAEDERRPVYAIEQAFLQASGFEAEVTSPTEFAAPGWNTAPLIFRHMVPFDWTRRDLDPDVFTAVCHADGLVLLPHSSYLIANKKTLALVSAGADWMSAQECALVRKYIPWTRVVEYCGVSYRGRRWDLPELLCRMRSEFVLKEATSCAGWDVLIGRYVCDSTWRQGLDAALRSGNWIAQEYVTAERIPVPLAEVASGDVVEASVEGVISPFLIDGRAAGCATRYALTANRGVVNATAGGVQLNAVASE